MARVLSSDEEFGQWLLEFLPQLLDPEYDLQPGEVGERERVLLSAILVKVVDRTDGKLVHLDGLNFSRAWCLYNIAARLVGTEPEAALRLLEIGDSHVRASLDSVVDSHYAGSHWLASFLLYALQTRQRTIMLVNELN